MKKNLFFTSLIAGIVAAATTTFLVLFFGANIPSFEGSKKAKAIPSLLTAQMPNGTGTTDFTMAAEKTVNAVVHVKTSYARSGGYDNSESLLDFFFGFRGHQPQPQPQQGAGSGVILSSDGYIVTNNHVIDKAAKITVTLNDKRTLEAKLIGADPSTDIAVLKIEAKDLPFITMGNSEALRLGEWVLAVGNPMNLTSTVTAGIVSAKARNINILSDNFRIESFIQTDAAVNPGNSGGALVNTQGELIGINTAIASQTGAYMGYSFAVPSSIVGKVTTDIIEFGIVQRAVLGVTLQELTSELAHNYGLKEVKGVFVQGILSGSAAEDAKLQQGDIILKVNDIEVDNVAQLQEQISKFRPNDQISLAVNRNNKTVYVNVVLRNRAGNTSLLKPSDLNAVNILGATLAELDEPTKRKLRIPIGVQVTDLKDGKLRQQGVRKGYIILRINRQPVQTVTDVTQILSNIKSNEAILFEGLYPNGEAAYYAIAI
ncbi:MAG: Do family serine endopeptidase [Bacteroidales bacterium]